MPLSSPTVNLHSPGPIGDTTPATLSGTTLTLTDNITMNSAGFAFVDVVGGFGLLTYKFNGFGYHEFSTTGFTFSGSIYLKNSHSAVDTVIYGVNDNLHDGLGNHGAANTVAVVINDSDTIIVTATAMTFKAGVSLVMGGVTIPAISKDTGWTANADSGSKTAVIPVNSGTIQTALNTLSAGAGDAFVAVQSKVKAIEAALALTAPLLPNA